MLCRFTTVENKNEEPEGMSVDECKWPALPEAPREDIEDFKCKESACECALLAAMTIMPDKNAEEKDEAPAIPEDVSDVGRKRVKVMRMPRRDPQKVRRKRACRSTARWPEANKGPNEIELKETTAV